MSKTWVPSVTRLRPTPSANSAVRIGRPIATTEPKVSSRIDDRRQQPDHERGVAAFFFGADFLDRLAAELDLEAVAAGALRRRR